MKHSVSRTGETQAASGLATDLLPKYSGLSVFQSCLQAFQAALQGIGSNFLRWHVLSYRGNNVSQLVKTTWQQQSALAICTGYMSTA